MAKLSRRWLLRLAAAAAAARLPSSLAQTVFPDRAVKIIVPFSAGSGIDLVARTVGRALERRWRQPVVVENRTGAGGNIGTAAVARSRGDGYTLLVQVDAMVINPGIYRNVGFDPVKDFTPLALAARADTPISLVAANALPVKSLAELVALAKAQPGKLNYASPGVGTPQHLAMELLRRRTGIDVVHVPFRTTSDAVTQVAAGDVQLMFLPGHVALQHAKAGRLRLVAVDGPARWPLAPEVPTFAESGVVGMDLTPWYGILGPAGVPSDVAHELNRAITEALKDPEVHGALRAGGLRAASGSAQ